MTDELELQSRVAKARRKRARQFAGMLLLLIGLVSGIVLYVGINLIALAVAP